MAYKYSIEKIEELEGDITLGKMQLVVSLAIIERLEEIENALLIRGSM